MLSANKLKITTPSDREILIVRDFDAPRNLVFDAMSRPEFLKRWLLGPPGWEMTTCEEDQRVGGAFHWAWRGPSSEALSMRGVYRQIVPPERIVRTESFDFGCAPQMGEQVATMVLTEKNGKTTLTLTVLYPSKEARDGAIASGMDQGMEAGYARLDDMLAETIVQS
jgi:uncharacterized protein YndB with AHSA1/START domain